MEIQEKNIIERIMEILYTYGIRSVSMNFIAQHIPLSSKDLFKIGKNKEEVIKKIFEYRFQLAQSIIAEIKQNEEVENAIEEMLQISISMQKACKNFNHRLDFEFQKYYPQLFLEYLEDKKKHVISGMIDNITRGQLEGIYKFDLELQKIVEDYYMNVMAFHQKLSEDADVTFVFNGMLDLYEQHIATITSEKGKLYYEKRKHILFKSIHSSTIC